MKTELHVCLLTVFKLNKQYPDFNRYEHVVPLKSLHFLKNVFYILSCYSLKASASCYNVIVKGKKIDSFQTFSISFISLYS